MVVADVDTVIVTVVAVENVVVAVTVVVRCLRSLHAGWR